MLADEADDAGGDVLVPQFAPCLPKGRLGEVLGGEEELQLLQLDPGRVRRAGTHDLQGGDFVLLRLHEGPECLEVVLRLLGVPVAGLDADQLVGVLADDHPVSHSAQARHQVEHQLGEVGARSQPSPGGLRFELAEVVGQALQLALQQGLDRLDGGLRARGEAPLPLGALNRPPELGDDLVEHVVAWVRPSSLPSVMWASSVSSSSRSWSRPTFTWVTTGFIWVTALERGVEVHRVVDSEDLLADLVAAPRCSAQHLLVEDAAPNPADEHEVHDLGHVDAGSEEVDRGHDSRVLLILEPPDLGHILVRGPGELEDAPSKLPTINEKVGARITREEPNLLNGPKLDRFLEVAFERWPQHYALILVLFTTTMRISLALALRWEDLDLDAREFVARRRLSGQGQRVEVVPGVKRDRHGEDAPPLLPEVLEELEAHRAGFNAKQRASGLVFPSPRTGGHQTRTVLDRPFKDILAHAGIAKRFTPHGCRRTKAKLLGGRRGRGWR